MPHVMGSGFADCADEGDEPSGAPDEDKEKPAQRYSLWRAPCQCLLWLC